MKNVENIRMVCAVRMVFLFTLFCMVHNDYTCFGDKLRSKWRTAKKRFGAVKSWKKQKPREKTFGPRVPRSKYRIKNIRRRPYTRSTQLKRNIGSYVLGKKRSIQGKQNIRSGIGSYVLGQKRSIQGKNERKADIEKLKQGRSRDSRPPRSQDDSSLRSSKERSRLSDFSSNLKSRERSKDDSSLRSSAERSRRRDSGSRSKSSKVDKTKTVATQTPRSWGDRLGDMASSVGTTMIQEGIKMGTAAASAAITGGDVGRAVKEQGARSLQIASTTIEQNLKGLTPAQIAKLNQKLYKLKREQSFLESKGDDIDLDESKKLNNIRWEITRVETQLGIANTVNTSVNVGEAHAKSAADAPGGVDMQRQDVGGSTPTEGYYGPPPSNALVSGEVHDVPRSNVPGVAPDIQVLPQPPDGVVTPQPPRS